MIKNIIFDIGNVLLKFKPQEHFKDMEHGEEVSSYVFSHPIWLSYDAGEVNLQEVQDQLVSECTVHKDTILHIFKHWFDVLIPKDYSIEKLKALREQGYSVFLLSNLSVDATKHIGETYGLFDMVDGYILSYQERVCKPDHQIYQRLFNKYDLIAEECLFLDDLEVNIAAAKELGMQGIVYREDKQVEKELCILLDGTFDVE